MNHEGEIRPLTALVRPHVAIVTTIEPVHIEFFRSIWSIADAKGEIFSGMETGGTAVLNRDSPYFERLFAHAMASAAGRVVSFGENAAADVRARIPMAPGVDSLNAAAASAVALHRLTAWR